MGWFFKTRRGPEWKQGWQGQAMDSASAPPAPLIAIVCIVMLFLAMSNHMDHRAYVYRKKVRVNSFLLFTPMLVIVVSLLVAQAGSLVNNRGRTPSNNELVSRAGEGSPWVVAGVVILLLVMVSYQPTFHPRLFPA